MITKHLEIMEEIYEKFDAVMIVNAEGVIEYSVRFDQNMNKHINEGYTGKHIFEVYPDLKKEKSTFWRVITYGKSIIDELQVITDYNNNTFKYITSAYPLKYGDKIVGMIEGTTILSINGKKWDSSKSNSDEKEERLYQLDDIITNNSKMKDIKEFISKVSIGNSTVMIIGDTGSGKELVAQSIHTHSLRSKGPFVSQNCSAIPVNLFESMLFGTEKGSFTGAEQKKGLFELANGGTLFFDELNSMDIVLQGKILKVIEEKKVRRIGGQKEIKIDVRIISAMNKKPFDLVESGEMRADLFYRLGVVQINLPGLSERKDDIPLLIKHFINIFNQQSHKRVIGVSDIAENILINYSWPGNVRELRNAIEYGFNVINGESITVNEIPDYILYGASISNSEDEKFNAEILEQFSYSELMNRYEKNIILAALNSSDNISEAAKKLRISRQVLNYKMTKHNLSK
ncbi:sigma-54 interaction domain-containing protein [Sinanaerobacter sp. ZZT-01]|uniref:sigma-54 interaction domain-containing protein n=1 Tax=Sinanaerobacter sp. ZZT-01 TaxID=3111540 RepID=UPI002D7984E3|nr:sigma 54-interacting transcriptional regulator [Sinanaerobacter sp. ZZT-01]WRR94837.1 sigma 54-interacting transcriptional regulator [Sinanaerobacter sp. ZZT-01]